MTEITMMIVDSRKGGVDMRTVSCYKGDTDFDIKH